MSEESKFKIIAVGGPEFTVGFKLAGLETVETTNPKEDFEKLMDDQTIGVIICDDDTLKKLPEQLREDVEAKVKPVTVALSTTAAAQETLRKKIIKSIGVDLWSK